MVAGVAATASLAAATPWVNYIVMNKFMTEFVNPNKGITDFSFQFLYLQISLGINLTMVILTQGAPSTGLMVQT